MDHGKLNIIIVLVEPYFFKLLQSEQIPEESFFLNTTCMFFPAHPHPPSLTPKLHMISFRYNIVDNTN